MRLIKIGDFTGEAVYLVTFPKQLGGKKGCVWLTGYSPLGKKSRQELGAGTLRQELKQRPWENAS